MNFETILKSLEIDTSLFDHGDLAVTSPVDGAEFESLIGTMVFRSELAGVDQEPVQRSGSLRSLFSFIGPGP